MKKSKETYISGKKVSNVYIKAKEVKEMYRNGSIIYKKPSSIEMLNWVNMSGSGYFDTGINTSSDVEIDIQVSDWKYGNSQGSVLFGAEKENWVLWDRRVYYLKLENNSVKCAWGNWRTSNTGDLLNKPTGASPCIVSVKHGGKFYIDGELLQNHSYGSNYYFNIERSLWLYSNNLSRGSDGKYSDYKLYYIKLTNKTNGQVLFEGKPAKITQIINDKSVEKIGLYDTVANKMVYPKIGVAVGG